MAAAEAAAAAAKETKIWKKGRVWLWQSRMKANWEGRGIALIRRVAAEGKEGGLFCVVVTRSFKYRGKSLSFAAVITCLNVLLPCLAGREAGGPSKPATIYTNLLPA